MQDIIIPDRAIKQSYKSKNKKTVNISTLSSLLLASLGYPSMKHGSGKNTTSVGSTEAIVHLGVPIIHKSREAARQALDINGFVYTDAIISKTIHDIS